MNHGIADQEMEERASLYALGALSQQETRAFDEHLAEGCEVCKAHLKGFESVTNMLAYDADKMSPSNGVRERLMARLSDEAALAESEPTLEYDDASPVVVRADEGEWQQMCAGVLFKQLFVDAERKTVTSLLKLAPGAHLPMHRHLGLEECYVIEGDVSANDETLTAGDYTCAMEGSIHHPISTVNGALVLIVGPESFEVLHH
jgi:predicted ChrR family anti-sigma factor